jgi:hypothetical protein
MAADWNALAEAGLPLQAADRRRPGSIDWARVRSQVGFAVIDAQADAWLREPLLAWLRGFRQHWPDAFGVRLGETGESAIARLEACQVDWNRYLKLRRIAIENLSGLG